MGMSKDKGVVSQSKNDAIKQYAAIEGPSRDNSDYPDKVQIPDTLVDSDVESETLSDKLKRIDAYVDPGQCSQTSNDKPDQHTWVLEIDNQLNDAALFIQQKIQKQFKNGENNSKSSTDAMDIIMDSADLSHDGEGRSEMEINSQESVVTEVGNKSPICIPIIPPIEMHQSEAAQDQTKEKLEERRRSERLKKDISLTTMEKNEIMAKKRSLEGNNNKTLTISETEITTLENLAKDMGVITANNDFAALNLVKDLEVARHNLFLKNQSMQENKESFVSKECMPDMNEVIVIEEDTESSGNEIFYSHTIQ